MSARRYFKTVNGLLEFLLENYSFTEPRKNIESLLYLCKRLNSKVLLQAENNENFKSCFIEVFYKGNRFRYKQRFYIPKAPSYIQLNSSIELDVWTKRSITLERISLLNKDEKSKMINQIIDVLMPKTNIFSSVGFIYFIESKISKNIKIGFSVDPHIRVKNLNVASNEPLTLLGYIDGTIQEEKELHKKFNHLKIKGEWFKHDKELILYLEQVLKIEK